MDHPSASTPRRADEPRLIEVGSDHGAAEADLARAPADHGAAEADLARAPADHGAAEADLARAPADHTAAGADHARPPATQTRAGSVHTELGPSVVEVWWARLSDLRDDPDWGTGLLVGPERERDAAYRLVDDRRRFRTGVVLTRLVLARLLATDPRAVVLDRACPHCGRPHGKVRSPGTGLHLSLTHSADLVGLAVSRTGPVGLDVEQVRPVEVAGLLGATLSAAELPWWTVHGTTDHRAFLRTWTRKEAVVKLTGEGLRRPLPEVVVSPPDTAPRLLALPGEAVAPDETVTPGGPAIPSQAVTLDQALAPGQPAPDDPITLVDLVGRSGYCAALAVRSRGAVQVVECDACALGLVDPSSVPAAPPRS